ncbi:hypothetical protein [Kribbella sp. NPDC051718]
MLRRADLKADNTVLRLHHTDVDLNDLIDTELRRLRNAGGQ